MKRLAEKPSMEFIGNHPVLDFHNTLAWPNDDGVNERLVDAGDLIAWSKAAGIVSPNEAKSLSRRVEMRGAESKRALGDARKLRKTIHDTLAPVAHGRKLDRRDLRKLNDQIRRAAASLQLSESDGRIRLTNDIGSLSTIVDRLAWSVAQLIVSDDIKRLSACANLRCGWLFLDESRNSSRKWCSMDDCGSRAKARRYYRRTKARARKSARI